MNTFQFIASLVSSLAWPLALIITFIILREPIIGVIKSIKHLTWKDVSADFGEDVAKLKEDYLEHKESPQSTLPQLNQDTIHQHNNDLSGAINPYQESNMNSDFDVVIDEDAIKDDLIINGTQRSDTNTMRNSIDDDIDEIKGKLDDINEIGDKLDDIESRLEEHSDRITDLEHRFKSPRTPRTKNSEQPTLPFGDFDEDDFQNNFNKSMLALAEINPASAVIDAWLRIETEIYNIAKSIGIEIGYSNNFTSSLQTLLGVDIIDSSLHSIILNMRGLRNKAAHFPTSEEISFTEAIEYGSLARSIIVDLHSRIPQKYESTNIVIRK